MPACFVTRPILTGVLVAVFAAVARLARSETPPSASELERQVVAVSEQARQAIVSVDWKDGKSSGGAKGVIVTADGHILLPAVRPHAKLTIRFPNGQSRTGLALGSSREWDVGVAKIDGPGSWPHVELAQSANVEAGQIVLTLSNAMLERPGMLFHPLLCVTKVDRTNGSWFTTTDSLPNWKAHCFTFDLGGRLLGGPGMNFMEHGTVHVSARVLRSIWDDLAGGKEIDQLGLGEMNSAPRVGSEHAAIAKDIAARATAASVQIREKPNKKGWSGTIVTKDGIVATCAHHFIMPGTNVVVSLPDGRDVAAEVLGLSFPCDIGLVRISEPGPYPFAEMGNSTSLLAGEPGLAVGYGPVTAEARLPRAQNVSASEAKADSASIEFLTDFKMVTGDSGGGLFDVQGRLVGIHCGLFPVVTHRRVELFRKHWDELHSTFDMQPASNLADVQSEMRQAAIRSRASVVEVLDGDKLLAMGTIVSADGRIITKASLLSDSPNCRLPDRRVLPARMVKTVRQYDLAVLQVEAAGLDPVVFPTTVDSPVGSLVTILAGREPPAFGCIAHPPLSIPAERGRLLANLKDGERGLEVTELDRIPGAGANPQLLQTGDVVIKINGHSTPNHNAYLALLNTEKDNPIAIAGDQVRLVVNRGGKQTEFAYVLGPPDWFRMRDQSARCSGFSQVRNVTTTSGSNLCGGPVLDRHGQLLGVAIAWRNSGWLLVLPATIVRSVNVN